MRFPTTLILLVLACVAAIGLPAPVHGDEPTEYQIKAAYTYKFAKFVEWSTDVLDDDDTLVQICVLGENPFGTILEEMVSEKTIYGRPISVVYKTDSSQKVSCNVVFIPRAEVDGCDRILRTLEGREILTISDIDDFAERGGMIGLYQEGQKIRFEISSDNLKAGGIRVSSKLLRLDRIVD